MMAKVERDKEMPQKELEMRKP